MSAISSLASAIGLSDVSEPQPCGIEMFDIATHNAVPGSLRAFQYFPETISDTKSPEWIKRSIQGGSHPVSTFINGGERAISFTAIFTQDKNPESKGLGSLLSGSVSFGAGSIASLFGAEEKHTTDISKAIAYLRSFTYPEYAPSGAAKSPPLAIIYLPNSGIVGQPGFEDSIVGFMAQCDVTYEAFHRNGAPRIVAVALSFVEIVQTSLNWRFVGREKFKTYAMGYKRDMKKVQTSKVFSGSSDGLAQNLLGGVNVGNIA